MRNTLQDTCEMQILYLLDGTQVEESDSEPETEEAETIGRP